MLSIPHMIVLFLVVLVVFGPQKLPELARSLGKLMAEFRKASGDFKNAFEEEMRDLERQARIADLKRQTAEANAAAATAAAQEAVANATLGSPVGTPALPESTDNGERMTEALVATPEPNAIPRLDEATGETAYGVNGSAGAGEGHETHRDGGESGSAESVSRTLENVSENEPGHDKQHRA
jgi:TatA/E family protein of Tat protein translocase